MEEAFVHKTLRGVMEYGDFDDLVEYRREIGWTVMPWIADEDDFAQAQARYRDRVWDSLHV